MKYAYVLIEREWDTLTSVPTERTIYISLYESHLDAKVSEIVSCLVFSRRYTPIAKDTLLPATFDGTNATSLLLRGNGTSTSPQKEYIIRPFQLI